MRRAHPNELDVERNVGERKKVRWTTEEALRLVLKEVELIRSGTSPAVINETLERFLPGRTVQSIKSKRRNAEHKQLVREKLAEAAVRDRESNERDSRPIIDLEPDNTVLNRRSYCEQPRGRSRD